MKFVNPKFEELIYDNPVLLGERCTRVCYKSENVIKEGSARKLLNGIIASGHTAMIEHITVYLTVSSEWYDYVLEKNPDHPIVNIVLSPYTRTTLVEGVYYISTNLRVINQFSEEMCIEYLDNEGGRFRFSNGEIDNCKFEDSEYFERRVTILFTMDRIGSQSFCRHRTFSFAQESTRWCNYLKDKFGSELAIITPSWCKDEDMDEFKNDMEEIEKYYFKWINKGYRAEEARSFLPFGLKTEIIMTGFMDAWKNFFALRNDSHAHPQAQELARPLEEYFSEKHYI